MKHLGNVCTINGAEIAPTDIITFGSPCQDMSIAGKREGIKHNAHGDEETTRSGLFYEAIRIIKEMREATHGEYPKYAVWENVPGAFSSNKGWDFLAVLEALCSVCDSTVSIPRPYDKKQPNKLVWNGAGEIVGDNFSICWRTLDAQYWGVPQRRKRIYLVADFNTRCAREILFKSDSLRGDMPQGNGTRKTTSADAVGSADGSAGTESLILKERAGCSGGGKGALWSNKAFTVATNQDMSVAFSFDSLSSNSMKSKNPVSGCREVDIAKCLDTTYPDPSKNQGGIAIVECLGFDMYNQSSTGEVTRTLKTPAGGDDLPVVCIHDKATRFQGGGDTRSNDGSGNGLGVSDNGIGYTLTAADRHAVCYQNTGRGWWNQSEIAETLRTPSGGDSTKANLVSFAVQETYQDKTGTLMANSHPESYTGQDAYNDMLVAGKSNRAQRKYIIRRLMPVECARLQGFPDQWGELAPFNPADSEFWESVRKTHAEITGKKYKPVKNLKKWYDKLHTDGAEYKMWGNGIALPCAEYVLHGIAECGAKTLGSLFDGSGGFPLAGAINGIIPLWSSEVEPYPIAVTKSRFCTEDQP
jgi:DNA (cytosine-5)-methyltransferase 1